MEFVLFLIFLILVLYYLFKPITKQDEENFKRMLKLENDKLEIQIEQQQDLFDLLKESVKEESEVIVD